MNDIIISLPIYLDLGKKKKRTFALNLNIYRNANFHILNDAKVLFAETIASRIDHLPKMKSVHLAYELFFGSRRAVDVMNICCIVDKFFCDTLVNCGKLPGDDKGVIPKIGPFVWGGIDTENPHVEVTLSNIELAEPQEPDQPMQISFTQKEIRDALVEYLEKQITLAPGQTVSLEFDLEDPTDIIAYIDVLREGQKSQGVPAKPEPAKVITNTPKAGETEAQTAVRKTRGPNKPKTNPVLQYVSGEAEIETETQPEPETVTEGQAEDPEAIAETVIEASADPVEPEFPKDIVTEVLDSKTVEGTVEQPVVAKSSIFPNIGSSAAVQIQPAAAPNPKSLFANLTRPSNAQSTQH